MSGLIVGWGRLRIDGPSSNILQQAKLPVAAHSDCSRINGPLLPVDEKTMLCAGRNGKGGCRVKTKANYNYNWVTGQQVDRYGY